jgi:hypothetical protein
LDLGVINCPLFRKIRAEATRKKSYNKPLNPPTPAEKGINRG